MSVPASDRPASTHGGSSLPRYLLGASRPRLWLYLGGTALVGLVWGAPTLDAVSDPLAAAVLLYFLVPANLFLYGVTDRFDASTDAANPVNDEAGPEAPYLDSVAVTVAILASGLLATPLLFVLPPLGSLALVAFLALSVAYSAPPLRLKDRPFLDSAANGLYVLPGVVGYAAVSGTVPSSLVVLAGWFWAMGMHTFSAIPGIEADREAGVTTTATLLGEMDALTYVIACWVAAAIGAISHAPSLGLVFLVYPAFGGIVGAREMEIQRASRWVPWINAFVGMVLTIAGLWRVAGGL